MVVCFFFVFSLYIYIWWLCFFVFFFVFSIVFWGVGVYIILLIIFFRYG